MFITKFALRLNAWHYIILWCVAFFFQGLTVDPNARKMLGSGIMALMPFYSFYLIALITLSAIKFIAYCKANPPKKAVDEKRTLAGKEIICRACGYTGLAKEITPGHTAIEVVLWICYFVPGFIYGVWRRKSRYDACPACGSKDLVPADSPIGKTFVKAPETDRQQTGATSDVIASIKDLESMWKSGSITEPEFAALKSQLIARQ